MRTTRERLADLLRRTAPYCMPPPDLDRELDLVLLELHAERVELADRRRSLRAAPSPSE